MIFFCIPCLKKTIKKPDPRAEASAGGRRRPYLATFYCDVDNSGLNRHTVGMGTAGSRIQIAVIGGGSTGQSSGQPSGQSTGQVISQATLDLAQEVGRLIAERDGIVICGGLGGVMESACRGAKSVGGWTVGIIPGVDRQAANGYVDVVIPTGFGEARNAVIVKASQAIIALPGRTGTLSEIAFALIDRKPVISLGSWKRDLPLEMAEAIYEVEQAEEAVGLAFRLAR